MSKEIAIREKVYGKPRLLVQEGRGGALHCSGCHYGIIYRVVNEVVGELGIEDRCICLTGASCSAGIGQAIDKVDCVAALHGQAPAVATAIKRIHPEAIVFTVQGDGDLAGIGLGVWMSAMVRAEKLTTLFMNNAGFGMTGGQWAPTTLVGMRTTTTPQGRDPRTSGFPIHVPELAAVMRGVAYSARCTVHTPANFRRAKKAVEIAFRKQMEGVGYSVVEFLSACPTNWGLSPVDCLPFIEDKMLAEYPLGEFKNVPAIEP